jgi:hypothetical protein
MCARRLWNANGASGAASVDRLPVFNADLDEDAFHCNPLHNINPNLRMASDGDACSDCVELISQRSRNEQHTASFLCILLVIFMSVKFSFSCWKTVCSIYCLIAPDGGDAYSERVEIIPR